MGKILVQRVPKQRFFARYVGILTAGGVVEADEQLLESAAAKREELGIAGVPFAPGWSVLL